MRQLILTTIAAPAWGCGDKPPPSEPGPQFGPVLTRCNFRTTRWVHKPSMPQPWGGLQRITNPQDPCSARLAPAEPCDGCSLPRFPQWHAVTWLKNSFWPASAQCLRVPLRPSCSSTTMTSMKDVPTNRAGGPGQKNARFRCGAPRFPTLRC